MKFAQEFRKSLQREGFPQRWVDSAIPYGQLKKCLKKVINELHDIGLDKDTLSQLASCQKDSADPAFHYHLDGKAPDSKHFRPRLTVFVHLQNGVAVDAMLTPATREFLQKIALRIQGNAFDRLPASPPAQSMLMISGNGQQIPSDNLVPDVSPFLPAVDSLGTQQVEVPLVFDSEFFDILQTDVSNLDTLQVEEQEKLKKQIITLGEELQKATKPSRGRKAKCDLATWRAIFELYLDARVFFSNRESDHGARTSTQACDQLRWFQEQVREKRLVQGFKMEASRQAFDRFLGMNAVLLQIVKFQEINSLAITKILKKFDKRTSLGISKEFPAVIRSEGLLAGSVARDVCAQMSTELITAIPRLDDFLCPICFAVAYWPVRLHCQHVFCSRCLVKMSRKGERFCPLCRADTIMRAGLENFDAKRAAFLRDYFPKEVKEKIRANERERNREIFGPHHSDVPCSVM